MPRHLHQTRACCCNRMGRAPVSCRLLLPVLDGLTYPNRHHITGLVSGERRCVRCLTPYARSASQTVKLRRTCSRLAKPCVRVGLCLRTRLQSENTLRYRARRAHHPVSPGSTSKRTHDRTLRSSSAIGFFRSCRLTYDQTRAPPCDQSHAKASVLGSTPNKGGITDSGR